MASPARSFWLVLSTARSSSDSAATLRRLSIECALAQEAVARGRKRWGEHFPCDPQFFAGLPGADAEADTRWELTSPWADPEFAAARTELFLSALALHKALVAAQARRIRGNLNVLVDDGIDGRVESITEQRIVVTGDWSASAGLILRPDAEVVVLTRAEYEHLAYGVDGD